MADYLLQEDGASKILLEDGSGALLLETSATDVSVPFISSATTVYALEIARVDVPFIASATTLYTPALQHGPTTSGYSETFTVSSTWECPPGITTVDVEVWGGGGGGGVSTGPDASGGGGGGAYASNLTVPVTPGTVYAVTIGGSGAAGTPGSHDGGDGGDSSFTGDSATQVLAKGGKGGSGSLLQGAGGAAAASIGTVKNSGGHGGDGLTGGAGGGGGAAASALGAGAAGTNGGAGGTGTGGGGSGGSGGAGGLAGHDGTAPGGGGGGDGEVAGVTAGAGAAGQIRITWGIPLPTIPSSTVVYPLTLQTAFAVPFIASVTTVYPPTVLHLEVDVPFIASKTRVYAIFSLFDHARTYRGPGNGGQAFAVRLAPNGTSEAATLAASITATDSLLTLAGDGALPSAEPFVLTIDDEVVYVVQITAGSYRIRGRGVSNTTPAAHTAGATVTWGDHYDMAITAGADIAHSFTADIASSGSTTYGGWLICYDSSQAYLGGSRYPMHVTEVLGVFDAGAGSTGTNRCDASQPNAVATATGVSDDCPSALSNTLRLLADVLAGDVALVRYTNPEASALDLGPRATALQSWFGLKRVDFVTGADVTDTDPNAVCVDTLDGPLTFSSAVNAQFFDPLSIGIGPDTGEPTPNAEPFTTVTLPGADRNFTRTVEKGWPICCLAVRQGDRRIPFWRSYDWHNFNFVYPGFGVDDTYAQILINRNGVSGSEPETELPGTQDIDGPNAVWDDGSYYFGVSWYVAIFATPYLVAGPSIGGTPTLEAGPVPDFVPTVSFAPLTLVPTVTEPPGTPVIEGGSGGGINPAGAQRFDAALV